jgi:hypothetical protein
MHSLSEMLHVIFLHQHVAGLNIRWRNEFRIYVRSEHVAPTLRKRCRVFGADAVANHPSITVV